MACPVGHLQLTFAWNQAGQSGQEADQLRKLCRLNLSSCYLNMGRYNSCTTACTEVSFVCALVKMITPDGSLRACLSCCTRRLAAKYLTAVDWTR